MAVKYQLITELYRRTGVAVAKNPQAWQSFLYTAVHNYHTTYLNQLLIHAQRPDSAACASILEYEGEPAGHARQQKHHRAAAPAGRGGDKTDFCHRRYHAPDPDAHRRAVGGHGHNAPAAPARQIR